jgi:hypothetical protein
MKFFNIDLEETLTSVMKTCRKCGAKYGGYAGTTHNCDKKDTKLLQIETIR